MFYKLSQNLINNPAHEAVRILLNIKFLSELSGSNGFYVFYAKDNHQARSIKENINTLLNIPSNILLSEVSSYPILPVFYPSLEFSRFEDRKNDTTNIAERILALHQISERLLLKKTSSLTIILCSSSTAMEKSLPLHEICKLTLSLKKEEGYEKELLIKNIHDRGYKKVSAVSELGQYAVRGGVLDVYTPLNFGPVRLEFAGEKLLSIRQFDIDSQRSNLDLDSVFISTFSEFCYGKDTAEFLENDFYPIYRMLADEQNISSQKVRYNLELIRNGLLFDGVTEIFKQVRKSDLISFWQNFSSNRILIDTTPGFFQDLSHSYDALIRDFEHAKNSSVVVPSMESLFLTPDDIKDGIEKFLILDNKLESSLVTELSEIITSKKSFFDKRGGQDGLLDSLLSLIHLYFKEEYLIILCLGSKQRFDLVVKEFDDKKIKYDQIQEIGSFLLGDCLGKRDKLLVFNKNFEKGFKVEEKKIVLITEQEIFNIKSSLTRPLPYKRASFRAAISNLGQLGIGDIVVHELYGIGKFLGLKYMESAAAEGEFLEVEYGCGSKLFVPVYDFLKVGKYQSSDSAAPALTVLGSGRWEAIRQKIKTEIANLTGNLLKTHAIRSLIEGIRFKVCKQEEDLFSASFPYVETPDQLRSINEVLNDMSQPKPMDRLVCGDVGYGKTEVAMRAAYRCVLSGYQVAVVAPTTLLVDQHYKNFVSRFSDFGINVSLVNRFRQKSFIKTALEELEQGKIDIIIGTHRLLQRDVRFKNLGLLVIDEEHKFGVAQKELLKNYRVQVDVLTLSATPIPRTLQQALHGTRELSVIETSPLGRQVVSIKVDKFSESLLLEAIDREILRGGQVYVVQHLITGLEQVRELIQKICPEVPCEIAHGKMRGDQIESVMQRFYEGTTKVLVSTAIIDSGLDVSNANTIIVLNPQDFGLAQLYQLKGRVGRGDKKAMSYFLYEDFSKLTDDSKRRLAVLESQGVSGSGFKLALQDMEIRGAGSLFGKDQTGHANAVGFDMYFKILEEAVRTEKIRRAGMGDIDENVINFEPAVRLNVDTQIPPELISDLQERLVFYQRSLDIKTYDLLIDFLDEFRDRYGFVSEQIENFLLVMLIRNYCKKLLIEKLDFEAPHCNFVFLDGVKILPKSIKLDPTIKNLSHKKYSFMASSLLDIIRKLEVLMT